MNSHYTVVIDHILNDPIETREGDRDRSKREGNREEKKIKLEINSDLYAWVDRYFMWNIHSKWRYVWYQIAPIGNLYWDKFGTHTHAPFAHIPWKLCNAVYLNVVMWRSKPVSHSCVFTHLINYFSRNCHCYSLRILYFLFFWFFFYFFFFFQLLYRLASVNWYRHWIYLTASEVNII